MNRVLVFMSDNRELECDLNSSKYHSLSVFINQQYCERYGYDFKYLRPGLDGDYPVNNCLSMRGNLRHASWSKILSSVKLIQEYSEYDYFIYLDTDCIFNNFDIPLNEYVSGLNVVNGNGFLESIITFSTDFPWEANVPNAGLFIFKNDDGTLKFFKEWYSYENDLYYDMTHTWEQNCLIRDIYPNDNGRICLFDDCVHYPNNPNQFFRHLTTEEDLSRIPYFMGKINQYSLGDKYFDVMSNLHNNTLLYNTNNVLIDILN